MRHEGIKAQRQKATGVKLCAISVQNSGHFVVKKGNEAKGIEAIGVQLRAISVQNSGYSVVKIFLE